MNKLPIRDGLNAYKVTGIPYLQVTLQVTACITTSEFKKQAKILISYFQKLHGAPLLSTIHSLFANEREKVSLFFS